MTAAANEIAASLRAKKTVRVLFVCLGNICRSPAAEGVFRSIVDNEGADGRFVIDSAGIGDWHIGQLPDRRMREHARRRGYELTHHARQVNTSDFGRFDLIIGMDAQNCADLRALAPNEEAKRKIMPMSAFFGPDAPTDSVPDPYYEGPEGFELVLDLLEDSLRRLFTQLR